MSGRRAIVLATGNELVTGLVADSNSAFIAAFLTRMGLGVVRLAAVADDLQGLADAILQSAKDASFVVCSGGLGPTRDDRTAQAAAMAAGKKLVPNQKALERIEEIFAAFGRPMTESNRKQALLPEGSIMLENPIGTAPGFCLPINGCLFFFVPGVPSEMERMVDEQVAPILRENLGIAGQVFAVKVFNAFGVTEAALGEAVEGIADEVPGLTVGLKASFPQIQIILYGTGKDAKALERVMEQAEKLVNERAGQWVYSSNNKTLEAVVCELLREKGQTLAMAESCTGGLISHWITGVAGSSDYFLLGAVTYSNQAKAAVLGVNEKTLAEYGAVSMQTAKEMALGAKKVSGADWAISTTGIAGPDGGRPGKPVGTVCIGIAGPDGAEAFCLNLSFGDRGRNKILFATAALDILRRRLAGKAVEI
jgi:nicotinamide-nucleotide amidase